MNHIWLLTLLAVLGGDDQPATLENRLLEINASEANHWNMYLDEKRQAKAELLDRPIYFWTNPTKGGGQFGSVFLWTHSGRPVAVASIFAHPIEGKRRITHELHSLTTDVLYPECTDGHPETWQPKGGLVREPFPDAPPPEASPARRLLQMRKLGRTFGGHTVDWRKQRWELRLLPQPLYRYSAPKAGIVDGGLFALVTDAGTDPEILLLLEATKDGWQFGLMRFTDSSFVVRLGDREIFSATRGAPDWTTRNNPEHTYRTFPKRFLTAEELGTVNEAE